MCLHVPKKISGFGMLNNVKVKNESACAQQKRRLVKKIGLMRTMFADDTS